MWYYIIILEVRRDPNTWRKICISQTLNFFKWTEPCFGGQGRSSWGEEIYVIILGKMKTLGYIIYTSSLLSMTSILSGRSLNVTLIHYGRSYSGCSSLAQLLHITQLSSSYSCLTLTQSSSSYGLKSLVQMITNKLSSKFCKVLSS